MPKIRTYSELRRLVTFAERFEYLKLVGVVGKSTFGFDRWMNQAFYTSYLWRKARDEVIVRDNGCDLGVEGYAILDRILVHHMNPITEEDLEHGEDRIINPDFLICTSRNTHQAIHFGDASLLPKPLVRRRPGDTKLW